MFSYFALMTVYVYNFIARLAKVDQRPAYSIFQIDCQPI